MKVFASRRGMLALDIIFIVSRHRIYAGRTLEKGEEGRMDELVNRWIATLAQARLIRYLN